MARGVATAKEAGGMTLHAPDFPPLTGDDALLLPMCRYRGSRAPEIHVIGENGDSENDHAVDERCLCERCSSWRKEREG